MCRRRPWFNASCRCLKLDRTLRGRAFSTAKLRYFLLAPGLRCHGPAPGGGSGRQSPSFVLSLSVIYKSPKPPDPGATSQGPAGGDGWYVFEWRRISPAFPLRVKGEPCVGGGRLARWVALLPAITLSWVTTRRWLTHQRRARGSFSQTDTLIGLLSAGEQYGL